MSIDEKTVDKLADLAKLEFNDESKKQMITDMNRMLTFVDKLQELDTDNVEPLIFMTETKNVWRQDIPKQEVTQKEALMNAPKKDSDYFKVPKVISK
jgi:aspartyl-tRNA(Asn)/glutamyl-tRNA(Gln) amidotransferase subunit C